KAGPSRWRLVPTTGRVSAAYRGSWQANCSRVFLSTTLFVRQSVCRLSGHRDKSYVQLILPQYFAVSFPQQYQLLNGSFRAQGDDQPTPFFELIYQRLRDMIWCTGNN